MRTKENSFRPRFVAQVVTVVVLAGASAACSNASRFGLPMFTGSTNASTQPGGVQPLPPATLGAAGVSGSGAPLTPNPGARMTTPGTSPSAVARADLPPLSPNISTAPSALPPAAQAPTPLPSYTDPRLAAPTSAPVAASGYPSSTIGTPAPRPATAPAPAPQPVAVASAGPQTVTVAPGQTLYSISRTYGVSVDAIMRENGIANASRVQAGQQIRIPGTSASASAGGMQVAANTQTSGTLGTLPGSTRTDAPAIPSPVPQPVPQPTVAVNMPPSTPTIVQTPPAAPTTPVAAPSVPPSASGTEFRWPVNGRIISSFGIKPDGERNDGINLAVPEGTSIKATEAGTVIYAGNEIAGYGNLILVRHAGGWVSAYAHAKEIMVERGQTVVRGQTIAVVGATGSVSQPQLHFELRQGSTPVNPLDHLSGA
jgi:murein DD-endopeptidase MepM/ murein hydrolase activator NlpD